MADEAHAPMDVELQGQMDVAPDVVSELPGAAHASSRTAAELARLAELGRTSRSTPRSPAHKTVLTK